MGLCPKPRQQAAVGSPPPEVQLLSADCLFQDHQNRFKRKTINLKYSKHQAYPLHPKVLAMGYRTNDLSLQNPR